MAYSRPNGREPLAAVAGAALSRLLTVSGGTAKKVELYAGKTDSFGDHIAEAWLNPHRQTPTIGR